MSDQSIDTKISVLLESLACPLSAIEAADGWTSESKSAMKVFSENLRKQLHSGNFLPPLNISRALDHWGVVSGELLEAAAKISNELRARA